MVAPSSGTSQVECEPYRHTAHSTTYRIPPSNPSTPYDQAEPRTLPSSSSQHSASSRISQSTPPASSSAVPPSSATPASQASQSSNQSASMDRPRATPQGSQATPPTITTHTRHASTASTSSVAASAANTVVPTQVRRRRSSSLHPLATVPTTQSPVVQLKDLNHLGELARADANNNGSSQSFSSRRRARFSETRFDISGMPVADIIELVAALLTKITTTNDRNHENLHRSMPSTDNSANLPEQATSVLAFHGKNVPTITIHSYLSRIHRYCPTTYEVFLSLLVYFDRMTERINAGTVNQPANIRPATPGSATVPPQGPAGENPGLGNVFVVDSYNIHRLVIAGVTCASKFFSDIFYTNSRYAKVGGLPLAELNHLELQFLTLNDFRLSIPVEELESYGNMLVQFYAREELAKTSEPAPAVE
ncbi:Cyclin-U4-1 [Orbilia brochopaga]|nr:Cyclin-U4-1 [Drechslerella brochopaga]